MSDIKIKDATNARKTKGNYIFDVRSRLTLPSKQSQDGHYWHRGWHVICEDTTPPMNLESSRPPPMSPPPLLSHLCLCLLRSHCPPNFSVSLSLAVIVRAYSALCCIVQKTIYCSSRPYLDFLVPPSSHPSHILFSVSTGFGGNLAPK